MTDQHRGMVADEQIGDDSLASVDLTIEELEERIQLQKKAEGGGSCGSSSCSSPTWDTSG